MKEIRWGILGCGDVAEKKSGPAFQNIANSKLVTVMRRDAEKAADFAKRHQVAKWYRDPESLINDPDVDAIYIATPPDSHEDYAIAALGAGKHVYLEKPMALSGTSAKKIEQKVSEGRGKLVVAHYRRALPAFIKVKEILESDLIGIPHFAEIQILQPMKSNLVAASDTNWRTNPSISGGGLFHDLAPHQLDLMINYFGAVEEASGSSENKLKISDADDLVRGGIRFKSGVNFQGLWNFTVPPSESSDNCEITGSKGKVRFSFFGSEVILIQNNIETSFKFQNPQYIQQPMIEMVVEYFLGRGLNPCSAGEGVQVMQIMDAFTTGNKK